MNLKAYSKFIKELFFSKIEFVTDYEQSLFRIKFEEIKNLKLIIMDFDDTLTDHLGELKLKEQSLLERLGKNYKLAFYSNSSDRRTKELDKISSKLKIYNVRISEKPDTKGFREILKHFKIKSSETLMIGDKIGTDIYGAYLAKIPTRILVKPYSQKFGGRKSGFFHSALRSFEKNIYSLTRKVKFN